MGISAFHPYCQILVGTLIATWNPECTEQSFFGHSLTWGNGTGGVCDICVARACADARHTNDKRAFPQTTLFVIKSRLVASWGGARHLLVTKKRTPH